MEALGQEEGSLGRVVSAPDDPPGMGAHGGRARAAVAITSSANASAAGDRMPPATRNQAISGAWPILEHAAAANQCGAASS